MTQTYVEMLWDVIKELPGAFDCEIITGDGVLLSNRLFLLHCCSHEKFPLTGQNNLLNIILHITKCSYFRC